MKIPKFEDKKISPITRVFYFIVGLITASGIVVYGVSWLTPPFNLSLIGMTLNQWISAALIVLAGIFAGSLIKSAILGKTKLD